jgi:hypothetical protein
MWQQTSGHQTLDEANNSLQFKKHNIDHKKQVLDDNLGDVEVI